MTDNQKHDQAARPLPFLLAWGLPILLLISTNFMPGLVPLPVIIGLMSGAFLWMGLACVLNARRCRRRHCYYSGPIFILGAIAVLLVGFQIIDLGRDGLIMVVYVTLTLALLTYLSEPVFGKYVD
ncbi:MAG: hypothetical protein EX271_05300 [Acidimicrobiales bacterium]|nr:hypothetical protein [Hyphomonadaceae bacterium]RZV42708.1 MAG: hypothetical protein EX271_05300 [Acidimicrobiales bacterium]